MLGALLIQPQMLARLQGRSAEQQLFDETIALLHRLVVSPALAGELAPAFVATLQSTAERVGARFKGGWPAFETRVRSATGPLVEGLQRHFGGDAPTDGAALLRRIADALDDLDGLPVRLSDAGIRQAVRASALALTADLGLSQQALRDEAAAFMAELAASLRGLQDVSPAARATALALACLLDRVRVELLPRIPPLDLGVDRLIELLLARLRWSGFEPLRARAGCLLGKAKAVLRALADGLAASATVSAGVPRRRVRRPAVPPRAHALARAAARAGPPAAPGSRAGDRHHVWYASWLFRRRLQNVWLDFVPRYPGDEVWQDEDRKRLFLRRVTGQDLQLDQSAQPAAWHEMAPFASATSAPLRDGDGQGTRFSFGVFPPAFLEVFTQVAAVVTDLGRSLWHFVRLAGSPHEYGQVALAIWTLLRGIVSMSGKAPMTSLVMRESNAPLGVGWLFTPFVTWAIVLIAASEGTHKDVDHSGSNFMYYVTLLGADALNAWLPERALRGGHDLLLSLFTLINQTNPAAGQPVPSNFEHGQAFIELGEFFGQLLLVLVIPRELYSYPGYETTYFLFFHWFVMAPLLAAAGSTLGALTAGAISRRIDAPGLARQAGLSALRSLLSFNLYLYLFREGDTDGGRYTTPYTKEGVAYVNPPHLPFAPYPDKATSPYKLPYFAGQSLFVGQAHFGAFSHMPMHRHDRPQVYAIDFAHDFRQPVLAVRAGTVVDWFDWVDDNTEPDTDQKKKDISNESVDFMAALGVVDPAWRPRDDAGTKRNYILVRHDTPSEGHDRTFNGDPTVTYAMYMHGARQGVRDAFQDNYGIAPGNIIGTKVRQGHTIMLAGNTGMSMHNHLHLQVMPERNTPINALRVPEDKLPDVTLPFVFSDIDEDDGVPRRLTWYVSGNEMDPLPPT